MIAGLARSFEVARASLAEERERPKVRRQGHELEFLPAAVEVLETPASPVGRAVVLLIITLFVVAIAWGWFGHIDTVAVAQGKIIPSGRIKVIQPLEIGIVRGIHVEEGQQVVAGDLLIELDPTETGADRDRLRRDLGSVRLELARLQAMLTLDDDPLAAFTAPEGADPDLVAMELALMLERLEEQAAKLAALDGEAKQRRADLAGINASIEKLAQIIPLLTERVQTRHILAVKGYGSKLLVLQLQQELAAHKGDLEIERNRRSEVRAALATLAQRRAEVDAAFQADLREDLANATQRRDALVQELRKAEQRYRQRSLVAPVTGTVQQLQVHTLGAVVTPAETLMMIVPEDSQLEIEAQVLNKDIGFVEAGQAVEIKVESFPFTRYGLIDGELLSISVDAVEDENRSLLYPARILMHEKRILVGERWVDLASGMSVTAEIKTGDRRLIEFFLSPFLRYQDEALRER